MRLLNPGIIKCFLAGRPARPLCISLTSRPSGPGHIPRIPNMPNPFILASLAALVARKQNHARQAKGQEQRRRHPCSRRPVKPSTLPPLAQQPAMCCCRWRRRPSKDEQPSQDKQTSSGHHCALQAVRKKFGASFHECGRARKAAAVTRASRRSG